GKRLEKIRAVFVRTFEILGTTGERLVREFADAHPPASIGRLENARQFYRFLATRWDHEAPEPLYLPDVAAFELAFAEVGAAGWEPEAHCEEHRCDWPNKGIRRAPGVVLLRCAYKIRP